MVKALEGFARDRGLGYTRTMACQQCDRPVRLPEGPGRVFVSAPLAELTLKILDLVRGWPETLVSQDGTLEGTTQDFPGFVHRLVQAPWSDLEKAGIFILYLPPGAKLTFASSRQTKSLAQWAAVEDASFLADIIERGSLVTHFHPIWDVGQGTLHGWECLTRGLDTEGRLIPPDRLFPSAARSGMTFPLDRLARQTALRQAQRADLPGRLFINFIPTAIYDPVFCLKTTVDLALSLGLDPDRIVFEVVETEEIEDEVHLKGIADYYRNKGFRVALDDVGSGYSSLNLLVALRPNVIKVDLKIVRNIDLEPANQAVFRALAGIAAETGAQLLAEGVETVAELDWTRANGATLAQGYLWGPPQAQPDIEGLLARGLRPNL